MLSFAFWWVGKQTEAHIKFSLLPNITHWFLPICLLNASPTIYSDTPLMQLFTVSLPVCCRSFLNRPPATNFTSLKSLLHPVASVLSKTQIYPVSHLQNKAQVPRSSHSSSCSSPCAPAASTVVLLPRTPHTVSHLYTSAHDFLYLSGSLHPSAHLCVQNIILCYSIVTISTCLSLPNRPEDAISLASSIVPST